MRILTRYILREVISHALIGIALFTFVVFMRDVGRLLELVVRNSAPLSAAISVFLYTLPTALIVTIPMGVLVGILTGLSRMAADSEVTALRASGMGVWTFVRIIAVFAIATWLLALANNVYFAPQSTAALERLQERLKGTQAAFEVQPRVFYEDFPNYVLYVQDVSAARLDDTAAAIWRGVFLADIRTPGAPKIILAEQAIVANESPTRIRLHLTNGSQHESNPKAADQYTISTFAESDIPLELPADSEDKQPVRLSRQVDVTPTFELPALAAQQDPARNRWVWVEFHRRFALPTACIVLVMLGIPLGLSARKGGKSTAFVLTILLVFVYYIIFLTGITFGRKGTMPSGLAVWMANIVFFIGGLFLLWRVDKMPLEIGSLRLGQRFKSLQKRISAAIKRGRQSSAAKMFSGNFPQILDNYVLRDFLGYLVMMLAAFVMLMVVFTFFDLLGDIIRNRVPLVTVLEYLFTLLPSMVYLMMPLSVLLAVLVTFGIMEKYSEVTAMKATGISIYRLVVPVLVIAAMISLSLFAFDHFYLPQNNRRQDALRNSIRGKPAQTYLRPDRKWIFGQQSTIYYYEFFDPDSEQFGAISVFQFDPETFQITQRVQATRAHWEEDLEKWIFEQGWSREFRGAAIEDFNEFEVNTFAALNEQPAYFRKEVKASSEMNFTELRNYISDLQQSGFDVTRLRVQLHRKFAYPLITFVMALLAVPFALSIGKRGALSGIATAIGIAVVYWLTSNLFEAMGSLNQLPPAIAAWSPDVIFALIAGYLILKVPT